MKKEESSSVPVVPGSSEIGRSTPLILQYLQAVDFMTANYPPNKTGRGDYLDIHFFAKEDMHSRANILRLVIEYPNYTGLQDEVWIRGKDYAYQFNAKSNPRGEYAEYHEPEGHGRAHLEEVVKIINELKAQEGSFIIIDHQIAFSSRGGVWENVAPSRQKKDAPIPPPNNHVLEGSNQ